MKPSRDPEGAEMKHLLSACELRGKQVLEIGCGDGAFMRQYARKTQHVVGIDPANTELQIARRKARSAKELILLGQGECLPFQDQAFEIAIFASSL